MLALPSVRFRVCNRQRRFKAENSAALAHS